MGKNKKKRNKSNKPVVKLTGMTMLTHDNIKTLCETSGAPYDSETIGAMCTLEMTVGKHTTTVVMPSYLTGEDIKRVKQMTGRSDPKALGMVLAGQAKQLLLHMSV